MAITKEMIYDVIVSLVEEDAMLFGYSWRKEDRVDGIVNVDGEVDCEKFAKLLNEKLNELDIEASHGNYGNLEEDN